MTVRFCFKRVCIQPKGLLVLDAGTGSSIRNGACEIDCTTILSLLDEYSIPRLDILKMDIEGAEEAVFRSEPETWLGA